VQREHCARRLTKDECVTAGCLDHRLEVFDLALDRVLDSVPTVAATASVVVMTVKCSASRRAKPLPGPILRVQSAPSTSTRRGPLPAVSYAIVVPSLERVVFMAASPAERL